MNCGSWTGDAARQAARFRPPLGPDFDPGLVVLAARLEAIPAPGGAWFILWDQHDQELARRFVRGW